jgi:hypothetical protein
MLQYCTVSVLTAQAPLLLNVPCIYTTASLYLTNKQQLQLPELKTNPTTSINPEKMDLEEAGASPWGGTSITTLD